MKSAFGRLLLVTGLGLTLAFGCGTNSKVVGAVTALPGQISRLLKPTSSQPKQLYSVQAGDTPLGVALRFHTSVDELIALNASTHPEMGQTPMKFNAGWQIWVPDGGGVSGDASVPATSNSPTSVGNVPAGTVGAPGGYFDDAGAQVIIDLTNKARADAGAPALSVDDRLMAIARKRAMEIVMDWGHQGLADDCADCGENILKAAGNPQSDFDLWMNSPSHRNNLMYAGYTAIGAARYIIGRKIYCVQLFHE